MGRVWSSRCQHDQVLVRTLFSACGQFLLVSPRGAERQNKLSGIFLYKDADPILRVPPPLLPYLGVIIYQRTYLQTTVRWGVRASTYDFGGGGEGDRNFPSITLSYTVVVQIK